MRPWLIVRGEDDFICIPVTYLIDSNKRCVAVGGQHPGLSFKSVHTMQYSWLAGHSPIDSYVQ